MNAVWPHLPALQVVIPLVGALLAGFLRRGRTAFALALLVSWIMPFIAIAMLWQVLSSGPISYHLGGWEPPWGIEYRVDALNGFVLALVSVVGAVIMPYRAPLDRFRDRGLAGGLVLLHVSSLPDRIVRHRDHGRRLQRVCVSRNFLAVDLRADRAWSRTAAP